MKFTLPGRKAPITANVLAIMSFTLNRVYTEWYRNQGYDFTITSSTAFDHKWIYGRNIFQSISQVVDEIFDAYLSRPGVRFRPLREAAWPKPDIGAEGQTEHVRPCRHTE